MTCTFDLCEFYNLFFGGIVTGIVASFLYILLDKFFKNQNFKRKYKYLESSNDSSFDWLAYSMRKDDGRKREDNPNGTILNIKTTSGKLSLTVNEKDRGIWNGILRMKTPEFGTITYKYETDYEFGYGNCIVGTFNEDGKYFDYIFFVRATNRIYYLGKIDEGKYGVNYNYGDELFLRERACV